MAINKRSFNKSQKALAPVSGPALIKRLNGALEGVPMNGQYKAIQPLITNREVAVLKAEFDIEEYQSTHQMIWSMINAYNEE